MDGEDLRRKIKQMPLGYKVFSCDEGGLYPISGARVINVIEEDDEYMECPEDTEGATPVILVE